MDCKYAVDRDGEVLKDGVRLGVNVFQQTGAMLMAGFYEKTGFGMTPQEMEAAVYLGLYE